MAPKPTLTDEDRSKMSGKMGKEIAALVTTNEISAEAAGAFLLEREMRKATKSNLVAATA